MELGGRRRLRKAGGEGSQDATGPDESLLAQILAEVTDGVVAFDLDFHFTYLNSAAEKVFNRKAEELVGNELWSELPSLLETTFGAACRRSMEQRTPITVEGFLPPFDAAFAMVPPPGDVVPPVLHARVLLPHVRGAQQQKPHP